MKKYTFVAALVLCGWCAVASSQTLLFTLDNNGNIDYTLTSVSSTEIYSGSLPVNDPLINLELGRRYDVTVVNSAAHPFQILAKAGTSINDVVILSQGALGGTLEGDVDINWQDDLQGSNGVISFTVTQSLVDAFTAGGLTPGYRCLVHPVAMRGDFNVIIPPPSGPDVTSATGGGFIEEGENATLSVTITGTIGPVAYAWLKDGSGTPLANGGNISGADTPDLTLTSLTGSDSGSYVLEFTDASKGVFTAPAIVLTVVTVGALPAAGIVALAAALGAIVMSTVLLFRRRAL